MICYDMLILLLLAIPKKTHLCDIHAKLCKSDCRLLIGPETCVRGDFAKTL